MSDCCSPADSNAGHTNKYRCPVCGIECSSVSARTIAHHIRASWSWKPSSAGYYFCAAPGCDVVYFGADGSTIVRSQLRTRVGVKEQADDSLLCYCFGVSRADLQRDPAIRGYVVEQTRAGHCSCETSNPSGRCCLKDFPKAGD